MGRKARQLGEFYKATSEDIFKFAAAMGFKPTWQQEELLLAVQRASMGLDSNWIACKSGQGPGKTTASAIVGLWRAYRRINAMTVVTAPTMRQIRDVWMAEVRRHMDRADPMFRKIFKVHKTKIEIGGREDWGIKTVTATKEENAQGFHEENMTVIVEEASGVSREIITQFKGTLSNPNSLFLMIGNPNTRDCAFFDCFHSQRHRWKTMTFNAEETPESSWFSKQRNKDLEEEFGRDSDVYRVRVLGEFPHADPNCVMSLEDVEACMDKALLLPCAAMRNPQGVVAKQFGIDYARFGDDESTIYRRSGNALVQWQRFAHFEPADVTREAFKWQRSVGWNDSETWFVADAGGMGQGVMFMFYEAGKNIVEFHNGGRAYVRDYANRISEAYFHVARLVKERRCYLPKDHILARQLTTRQYHVNKKGQIILESKDEYEKRGNESPDRADGAVLALYDQVMASGNIAVKQRSMVGVRGR